MTSKPRHLTIESLEDRFLLAASLGSDIVPPVMVPPTRFASEGELRQFLVDSALDRYGSLFGSHFKNYPFPIYIDDHIAPGFVDAFSSTDVASGSGFSQTNVQVPGVD